MATSKGKIITVIIVVYLIGIGSGYALYPFFNPPPQPVKTLNVITWAGSAYQAMQTIANDFTKSTGVPVVIGQQGSAAETFGKVRAQWPSVPADVVTTTPAVANQMLQLGYLAPITPKDVPNINSIPAGYDVKGTDGQVYGAGLQVSIMMLAWRTDLYPKGVKGLSDIFSPDLRGKVGVPAPSFCGACLLVQLAIANGGSESNMGPGLAAAKRLAPNIGLVYSSDQAAVNGLTTGQVAVEYLYLQHFLEAKKTGAPVNGLAVFNDTKTTAEADVVALLNGPNKALAYKFLDFALSGKSQSTWAEIHGVVPASGDANAPKDTLPYIRSASNVPNFAYVADPTVTGKNGPVWVSEWNTQVQPLIKK